MNKGKIILIGGGGHCKSLIDVIEQENKFQIAGIIEKKELIGSSVLGYNVVGCNDNLLDIFKNIKNAIIAIGHLESNVIRVSLYRKLKNIGFNLPVIISPLAYVSKYASIDEGTVVMHQALVNADTKIGKNCIINSKALIEHDVTIKDNCHISTGSIVNGGAVVEANTFFGSNATSKQYISINGFVKAGSVFK